MVVDGARRFRQSILVRLYLYIIIHTRILFQLCETILLYYRIIFKCIIKTFDRRRLGRRRRLRRLRRRRSRRRSRRSRPAAPPPSDLFIKS